MSDNHHIRSIPLVIPVWQRLPVLGENQVDLVIFSHAVHGNGADISVNCCDDNMILILVGLADFSKDVFQGHTRFGRDGEEQVDCSGYLLKDVLEQAGLDPFEHLTVTAADGFSTMISLETAMAETTLLCLEENNQLLPADSLPMLAVDGEGGNVWVRQIDRISAE